MSSMSPVRVGTPLQAAAPRTHGRSLLPLSWGGACARPRRISKAPRTRSLEALEGVHPTRHHQRQPAHLPRRRLLLPLRGRTHGPEKSKLCSCHFVQRPGVRPTAPRAPRGPGPVCSEAGCVGCTSGGHARHAAGPPGAPRGGSSPPRTQSRITASAHRTHARTRRLHEPHGQTRGDGGGRVRGAPPPLRHCDARPRPGHLAGRPPAGAPTARAQEARRPPEGSGRATHPGDTPKPPQRQQSPLPSRGAHAGRCALLHPLPVRGALTGAGDGRATSAWIRGLSKTSLTRSVTPDKGPG